MDKTAKIVMASLLGLGVLFTGALVLAVQHEAGTFARNEKIIADAIAAREARMTPAERAARDEAVARAAEAAAKTAAEAREQQARETFIPSARGACLVMLQQVLHDPGSAGYGRTADWPAIVDGKGRAVVLPRIRAKNGFGALRIAEYRCVVDRVDPGHVRVVSLDLVR